MPNGLLCGFHYIFYLILIVLPAQIGLNYSLFLMFLCLAALYTEYCWVIWGGGFGLVFLVLFYFETRSFQVTQSDLEPRPSHLSFLTAVNYRCKSPSSAPVV